LFVLSWFNFLYYLVFCLLYFLCSQLKDRVGANFDNPNAPGNILGKINNITNGSNSKPPMGRSNSGLRISPGKPSNGSVGGGIRSASPHKVPAGSGSGKLPGSGIRGSASGLASPVTQPQKAYVLKVTSIHAKNLKYVSFPLCPLLKFRVDAQGVETSKNLYAKDAVSFPESFEFELNVLKYKAGLEVRPSCPV
jgi:hypothetical protein